MLPCSFDNQELRWVVDLNTYTIKEAWNSEAFDNFREYFKNSCAGCKDRLSCFGGCPIRRQIVLCNRKEKELYEG
jgi:radical SAM protein with 4Fe4S-binding SPASM domain